MKRLIAVVMFGGGLLLVGVALGLLYMDVREHEAIRLSIEAQSKPGDTQAIETWKASQRVWSALWAGSIGAGLAGAGVLLGLFELPWFDRRGSERAGP